MKPPIREPAKVQRPSCGVIAYTYGPQLLACGWPGSYTHYRQRGEGEALCGARSAKKSGQWGRRKPGGSSPVCNACHAEACNLRATIIER